MKTTRSRKLILSRETVRRLDAAELARAAGGILAVGATQAPTCYTCTCPTALNGCVEQSAGAATCYCRPKNLGG